MGGGTYSISNSAYRSIDKGWDKATSHREVYTSNKVDKAMEPKGISAKGPRECRDSEDHPNAMPVIIAFDVTGSMGDIPFYFVKEGLHKIIGNLYDKGFKDAQILFAGIGDHKTDTSPFQAGEFESNDEALDGWLTKMWLEGGGGGNGGESYLLAWYFASAFTVSDHWEKRNKKGVLITIGDEQCHSPLGKEDALRIFGSPWGYEVSDMSARQLYDEAKERYECYHLHIANTSEGSRSSTIDFWQKNLGENVIIIKDEKAEIANVISGLILRHTVEVPLSFPSVTTPVTTPEVIL